MVGIETFYGFVPNENFCTPSPPLIGDFAKKSEKNGKSSIGVNVLGWGGSEGWSLNSK